MKTAFFLCTFSIFLCLNGCASTGDFYLPDGCYERVIEHDNLGMHAQEVLVKKTKAQCTGRFNRYVDHKGEEDPGKVVKAVRGLNNIKPIELL